MDKKKDDSVRYMSKIVRELNKLIIHTMQEEGIGTGEIDLIHTVRHHPGLSQKEIGELLNMDKGAMARRVASLERKGYLTREPNSKDGRSQLIYATSAADSLKNSKANIEEVFFQWLYAELSQQEKQAFQSVLNKLYLRSKKESRSGFPHVAPRLLAGEDHD